MSQPSTPSIPPAATSSSMALVSLISGITGWTVLPFLGAIVAIITGHMAKSEIKKSGGMLAGNGMATAGLILGYASIALGICLLCLFFIFPLVFGVSFFGPILQAIGSGN